MMKKTFLGVGLGPIQTSIFLDGAFRGGFDRLVIADVDAALIAAVRQSNGTLRFNTASRTAVTAQTITGVEVFNPTVPADQEALIAAAAEASEIATALPSIAFFKHIQGWLRAGFGRAPERRRLIYAAENHNHAAEALAAAVGSFPATHYLNTVIGKMSCVFPAAECAKRKLPTLTPAADRGHLVEEFNRILIQACAGIEQRRVQNLTAKPDLLPFEEAKLYGHNALHVWLGLHAQQRGLQLMDEISGDPALLARARIAFVQEVGAALCKKRAGVDELFTPTGFAAYADDLLQRMVNPFLTDRVDRVCRDLERKLGWDDRLIGAIRLALSQGIEPAVLVEGAVLGVRALFGADRQKIRSGLEKLWGAWNDEAAAVWERIAQRL
jgi:mannitol-1-phosphate 5-dehydrogenase